MMKIFNSKIDYTINYINFYKKNIINICSMITYSKYKKNFSSN